MGRKKKIDPVYLPDKLLVMNEKSIKWFIDSSLKKGIKKEDFKRLFDSFVTSNSFNYKNIGRNNVNQKNVTITLCYKDIIHYEEVVKRLGVLKLLGLILETIVIYENKKIKKVSYSRSRRGNHKRVYVSGYKRRSLYKEDEL